MTPKDFGVMSGQEYLQTNVTSYPMPVDPQTAARAYAQTLDLASRRNQSSIPIPAAIWLAASLIKRPVAHGYTGEIGSGMSIGFDQPPDAGGGWLGPYN